MHEYCRIIRQHYTIHLCLLYLRRWSNTMKSLFFRLYHKSASNTSLDSNISQTAAYKFLINFNTTRSLN
jgi:hypothetical protein